MSGTSILHDAVRYLAQREHFEREIRLKLSKRGHAREDIDAAIKRLVADDLLSESRAFHAYLRSRIARGMGPEKIKAELDQLLSFGRGDLKMPKSDSFWCKVLAKHWGRRFGEPPEWPLSEKRIRHCTNRGFSYRLVRMMVVDYAQWEEAGDLDHETC